MDLTTCPVLMFDPEVREIFRWFYATHDCVSEGLGPPMWRRVALPAAGGVGDQDARLLAAIDFLAIAMSSAQHRQRTRSQREHELREFLDEHRRA